MTGMYGESRSRSATRSAPRPGRDGAADAPQRPTRSASQPAAPGDEAALFGCAGSDAEAVSLLRSACPSSVFFIEHATSTWLPTMQRLPCQWHRSAAACVLLACAAH